MYKIVALNHQEFWRECELFSDNTFERWQDLREHFSTQVPAGGVGSAGSQGEYMYENNGELPPNEPWVEYWVSDCTLQAIWNYLTTHKYWFFYEYIAWLEKHANLYDFRNVCCYKIAYLDYKLASRKLVPKKIKKELRIKASIAKNRKVEYWWCMNRYYAVKHPDYNCLIDMDGNIITKNCTIYINC